MWFASDNTGPAAPEIIEAVAAANAGHAPSYGADATASMISGAAGPVLSEANHIRRPPR